MSNSWIEVEYIGGYIAVRSKWNDALTMLTLAEASELARDLSAVVAANSIEYDTNDSSDKELKDWEVF